MKDFTFDGFSKKNVMAEFLQALEKPNTFGLYMKNVNKFYLFSGEKPVDLKACITLQTKDF